MNEPPRKLQIVGDDQAGFCDPGTGVCRLPTERHADDDAATADAPAVSADQSAADPVT